MRLATLLAFALCLGACTDSLTQLVVVVDTDLPAGALDQLEVSIIGPSGATTMLSEVVGPTALALPATLGVVPESEAELGPLVFVARGSLGGVVRVERSLRTDFVRGATRRVDLILEGACYDVSCEAGTTCRAGLCVDDRVDADELPPWRGSPEPLEGGVVSPRDAGTDALDDAALDATPDATLDGAPDATLDGGVDDGPRHPQRVAAGAAHSCALMGGVPYCWGSAANGRIDDAVSGGVRLMPAVSRGVTDAVELAVGRAHGCVVLGDGRVGCWGAGGSGQRGNGTVVGGSVVAATGVMDAVEVRTRHDHSCARLATGRVFCWGAGGDGQLGDDALEARSTPVEVVGIGDAVELAIGETHSCARRSFGEVMCWGSNGYGQLGDGTTDDALTPVLVRGISDAARIAAGAHHTCAVSRTGELRCWGRADEGQLGDGRRSGFSTTPQEPIGLGLVVDVGAGRGHTCAADADGAVSCVGAGMLGQLGAGETMARTTWVGALGLTGIDQFGFGSDHGCSLRGAAAVRCWGDNASGQVGNGESGTVVNVPTTVLGLP